MTTNLATKPETVFPSREEVEDFLYLEAQLLDEWRLDEWLSLFKEGATYHVPTAGSADDADAEAELFYIADDYHRLCQRVIRLKDPQAHSEFPRSICSRTVNNIRNLGSCEGGWKIRSTFITFRSKGEVTDTYFGHHLHLLVREGGNLKIASKRSILDMMKLRPQGRVSIII